jgi:hypothetical protein
LLICVCHEVHNCFKVWCCTYGAAMSNCPQPQTHPRGLQPLANMQETAGVRLHCTLTRFSTADSNNDAKHQRDRRSLIPIPRDILATTRTAAGRICVAARRRCLLLQCTCCSALSCSTQFELMLNLEVYPMSFLPRSTSTRRKL